MNAKLKTLGLALVAALALIALMASAAQAQFTSSSTHTILSGTQEGSHEFTAGEGFGGISCSTATFSGTSSSTNASSQELVPTYSGCKDSFGRTVHIDNNNFKYNFTVTGHDLQGTPIGSVHVTGTMTLTVTSGGSVVCTVHIISPQTANGVVYHSVPTGLKATSETVQLISITTGGFFSCGISEGEHKEGTYTGVTNITGKDTSGKTATISVD
jgi:hypothetical protein